MLHLFISGGRRIKSSLTYVRNKYNKIRFNGSMYSLEEREYIRMYILIISIFLSKKERKILIYTLYMYIALSKRESYVLV